MLVRYQWSEDGEVEVCEKNLIKLEQQQRCYHCNRLMSAGEDAVQLIAPDGDIYLLHEKCAVEGLVD